MLRTGAINCSTMESMMNIDDIIRRVRENFQTHLANDGCLGPFLHDFDS